MFAYGLKDYQISSPGWMNDIPAMDCRSGVQTCGANLS